MRTPRRPHNGRKQRRASTSRSDRASRHTRTVQEAVFAWRVSRRVDILKRFALRSRGISWSAVLMQMLLEELHAEDVVTDLIGDLPTHDPHRSLS
jgi:hypothetical protein